MKSGRPAPPFALLSRDPCIVKPSLVQESDIPVRPGGPGERRNRIYDHLQGALIRLRYLFSLFAIFNINVCSIPFDDLARLIAQWIRPEKKPSIDSIEAAHARFHLNRSS